MSWTDEISKHKNAHVLEFKCLVYVLNWPVKVLCGFPRPIECALAIFYIQNTQSFLDFKLSTLLAGSHHALLLFHVGCKRVHTDPRGSAGHSGRFWLGAAITWGHWFRSNHLDRKIRGFFYAEVKNVLIFRASLPSCLVHAHTPLPPTLAGLAQKSREISPA